MAANKPFILAWKLITSPPGSKSRKQDRLYFEADPDNLSAEALGVITMNDLDIERYEFAVIDQETLQQVLKTAHKYYFRGQELYLKEMYLVPMGFQLRNMECEIADYKRQRELFQKEQVNYTPVRLF